MDRNVETLVSIAEPRGAGVGNLILENARFFGRPNFSGEEDRFRDSRRKFTVIIPNDVADQLREIGWNVKTTVPTDEDLAKGLEEISHMKVFMNFSIPESKRGLPNELDYESGPDIHVILDDQHERLNSRTVGMLDRSSISQLDLEIRGWEYDPEDAPGKLSARLVKAVATLEPDFFDRKYGGLLR